MVWDNSWESLFKKRDWGEYPNEELIKFIAKHYYKVSNRYKIKILELGCGPGANIWYLAREKFNVHGIDGSKTAINKCIKRLNKFSINHIASNIAMSQGGAFKTHKIFGFIKIIVSIIWQINIYFTIWEQFRFILTIKIRDIVFTAKVRKESLWGRIF